MKFRRISLIFLFILFCLSSYSSPLDLRGRVFDAITREPLPGATISIPELGISTAADRNGEFNFNHIPAKGVILVEVKFVGYKTIARKVDLSAIEMLQLAMEPSRIEVHEVVITGSAVSAASRRNSASVSAVNKAELLQPSKNLVDAISRVPGVSQISTGPAISKPVIRGLGYNRVVTVDDGVKQQGQQWGDEHGIEIDQFKADRVEVLRGAASLLYGSDALGGVINLPEPLTVPDGTVKGEVISNYSTNNGLSSNSLMLTGNEKGFVWRARGSYKSAYSFRTPAGYFPNSGYNELNLSGMLGVNKKWGYTHLNFSSFGNNIGFYDPVLDSAGNFISDKGFVFTDPELKSRTPGYPRQNVRHYKISLNNNIILGSGYIKADLGFQTNDRREFEDTPVPNLFFRLNTYSADLKYYPHESRGFQPVFGISADAGKSQNKGREYLIPDYGSYGAGAFVYIKKSWTNSTVNAGVRYDYRRITGEGLNEDGVTRFVAFSNSSSNVSGAVGFTHQIGELFNFKANAGTAFRSPNPAELGSNGVHEGAFRYEIGNPGLQPERSYQADATFELNTDHVSASLGVYNNYIHDYIYASSNRETINADGTAYPLYRYGQVNANLYGAEGSLTIHPLPLLHLENTFTYTHATNVSFDKPLPFIPAAALRNELKVEPKIRNTEGSYISIGIASYFKQPRVDPDFETSAAGYALLNAGVGTSLRIKGQSLRLLLSADNLLNKRYYSALSRLRPGRLDPADPTLGVYDPGRNITFGIYVPFSSTRK